MGAKLAWASISAMEALSLTDILAFDLAGFTLIHYIREVVVEESPQRLAISVKFLRNVGLWNHRQQQRLSNVQWRFDATF